MNQEFSDRIVVCRVLAILGVTFVHVPPGSDVIPGSHVAVDVCRYILINLVGHASVPVLSIVAGYLFMEVAARRRFRDYVTQRFGSLMLPMISWNVLLAILLLSATAAGMKSNSYARLLEMPVWDWALAVSDRPINYPLYFLRDMFILSLASPMFAALGRLSPSLLVAAGVGLWLSDCPLLLRPFTAAFFCLGIAMHFWRLRADFLDGYRRQLVVVILLSWAGGTWLAFHAGVVENLFQSSGVFDVVNRISVAVLIWLAAGSLVRNGSIDLFKRVEPKIYLVFLSHVLVLSVAGGLFSAAFGDYATPLYLVLLLAAPLLCFLAVEAFWPMLATMPAAVQRTLVGKSVRTTALRPRSRRVDDAGTA